MKTKSFLAAMMAVALSFNFVACSDDNEPNGGNGGGSGSGDATKRLIKVETETKHNGRNVFTLAYNNEGRVSEASLTFYLESGTFSTNYEFTYDANEVNVATTFNDEMDINTYILNDSGYIESGINREYASDRNYTFTYTNDYLTSYTYEGNPYGPEVHELTGDGAIVPDDWEVVEYSDIPNKSGLFFYSNSTEVFDDFEFYELYYAGLLGKAPTYLPKRSEHYEGSLDSAHNYSYEVDDEGYVTSFTITDEDGEQVTTATCTYEDIN